MAPINATSHLLNLPSEILGQIFAILPPSDVCAFGQTCQAATTFILPSNQVLWRHAFLHIFDDPASAWSTLSPTARAGNAPVEADWDWYANLRRRCSAIKAFTASNKAHKQPRDLGEAIDVLVDIIETACSSPSTYRSAKDKAAWPLLDDGDPSLSIETLENAFYAGPHAERCLHDFETDTISLSTPSDIVTQLTGRPYTRSMVSRNSRVSDNASRLHIYYGLTRRERSSPRAQGAARQLVYDWSLTGANVDYGPWKRDGSGTVNWNLLEAVCSLIGHHFELLTRDAMGIPQGLRWAIPNQMACNPSQPEDWARVTGSWLGTYAFLDYSVLHGFNVAYAPNSPRLSLDSSDEARGDLMRLQLRLDDSIKEDPRLATDMPVCQDLPMLYFSGTSRGHSASRPHIQARGTVSLVPGARQVRWRYIIR